MAYLTYKQAIDAGVDIIDTAVASMSGLTSQPSANSLLRIEWVPS